LGNSGFGEADDAIRIHEYEVVFGLFTSSPVRSSMGTSRPDAQGHFREDRPFLGSMLFQLDRITMIIRTLVIAISLLFIAGPVLADSLSSMFGVYVYPNNKQTSSQQANDESVCYKSAKTKTGVDPANLAPATAAPTTQRQGGALRGAAGGAAVGAAVGAIGGNAGTGAGIGATLGAVRGRRLQTAANNAEQHYAQANVQAQQSQKMNNFRRAFAACLESKGYTVK
jgi:hypothetical protein